MKQWEWTCWETRWQPMCCVAIVCLAGMFFASVSKAQEPSLQLSSPGIQSELPVRLPTPEPERTSTRNVAVGTGTIDESQQLVTPEPAYPAMEESFPTGWNNDTSAPRTKTFFSALPSNRFHNQAPKAGNAIPDYSDNSQEGFWYHYDGLARSYYNNNQRIEFTGQEATFAVEGVLRGGIHHQANGWDRMVEAELFFTQPFDQNILIDSPERRSFAGNFVIDPVQISQLYLGARKEDWFFCIGRVPTPFGRYYYSNFFNNFSDSPFIRSEAIIYRETGAMMQWDPEGYCFTAAITNGQFNQDTNSAKAFVGRAGIDRENFALGASVKWQDGVGSEIQKQYKNHVGIDMMFRSGRWTLSGECIYDQYGFRRNVLTPNDVFWGRSVYYRDVNKADRKPVTGAGYYVNLGYRGDRWDVQFAYGDYFPEQLGILPHDISTHRGLLKTSRFFTPNFEIYGIALIENSVTLPFENRIRSGLDFTVGAQFSL